MKRVPVYILAGGRSSRFGSDKARAIFNDQPLLCRIAALLEPIASEITVVADRADKYADLGFRTIADRRPGLGPMAGLDTALHDLPDASLWLMLCPCDAILLRRPWLDQLLNAAAPGIAAGHDAVAFKDQHWQPMPALYHTRAMPTVAERLADNDRSMQSLLDRLSSHAMSLPADWADHWQANTPDELRRHGAR